MVDTVRQLLRVPLAVGAAILTLGVVPSCRGATEPLEHTITLEVAAARVPCVGMFPMECIQVREQLDAPWTRFYDPIAGFTYVPGFQYVLRVAWRDAPNPPADGSSRAYRLVAVLSKVPAAP
jgi:hypothetical protein